MVDNLATGHLENLDPVKDKIEFVQGDLADMDVTQNVVRDMEIIFHQAALPSVPRSIKNPRASHDANLTATLNLMIAARDYEVKRVVLASSSSVYGNSLKLPKVESFEPQPLSPYAVTKLACEYYPHACLRIYTDSRPFACAISMSLVRARTRTRSMRARSPSLSTAHSTTNRIPCMATGNNRTILRTSRTW